MARVTRGYGMLEEFFARKRARAADALIPQELRKGRLLDVGCGSYPLFLTITGFSEKYGIDMINSCAVYGITLISHDLHSGKSLPFPDERFDVVTMLAVFEHIEKDKLPGLVREIRRVLKPGGLYILTTPAAWTDRLLRLMAKLRLVSSIEIEDHKDAYSHFKIASILQEGGFRREDIRLGYFEAFMNVWATAKK